MSERTRSKSKKPLPAGPVYGGFVLLAAVVLLGVAMAGRRRPVPVPAPLPVPAPVVPAAATQPADSPVVDQLAEWLENASALSSGDDEKLPQDDPAQPLIPFANGLLGDSGMMLPSLKSVQADFAMCVAKTPPDQSPTSARVYILHSREPLMRARILDEYLPRRDQVNGTDGIVGIPYEQPISNQDKIELRFVDDHWIVFGEKGLMDALDGEYGGSANDPDNPQATDAEWDAAVRAALHPHTMCLAARDGVNPAVLQFPYYLTEWAPMSADWHPLAKFQSSLLCVDGAASVGKKIQLQLNFANTADAESARKCLTTARDEMIGFAGGPPDVSTLPILFSRLAQSAAIKVQQSQIIADGDLPDALPSACERYSQRYPPTWPIVPPSAAASAFADSPTAGDSRPALEIAAAAGNADAMYELGVIYEDGLGTDINDFLSLYWTGRAAEMGSPEAMFRMGQRYLRGEGVNADADSERRWMKLAYHKGLHYHNSLGMDFVLIEPGDYMMGSPDDEPGRQSDEVQHEVRLTNPILMSDCLVTRGQFNEFVTETHYRTDAEKERSASVWNGANYETTKEGFTFDKSGTISYRNPGFKQTDDDPVVEVSWNDANAFCNWLWQREGMNYRLPLEVEWEYACRAGTTGPYFWDGTADDGKGYLNAADQSLANAFKMPGYSFFKWSDGFVFTSPVKSFKPNPWGLYDMNGNAKQWCWDLYGPYLTNSNAPSNQETARVLRGGSWASFPASCRSAHRYSLDPTVPASDTGFRVIIFLN